MERIRARHARTVGAGILRAHIAARHRDASALVEAGESGQQADCVEHQSLGG